LLSSVASKVIGQDAGILVAAIGQLEETNLTMQQIKNIGAAPLSYLKENNPTLAKEIIDSVPALRERWRQVMVRREWNPHALAALQRVLFGERGTPQSLAATGEKPRKCRLRASQQFAPRGCSRAPAADCGT
jgi:hypothetical protein